LPDEKHIPPVAVSPHNGNVGMYKQHQYPGGYYNYANPSVAQNEYSPAELGGMGHSIESPAEGHGSLGLIDGNSYDRKPPGSATSPTSSVAQAQGNPNGDRTTPPYYEGQLPTQPLTLKDTTCC
jgi:hypothetical protein